ncbi:acireductone dioxygenase 2-like [Triticum urartu]|uniref:acireductone dioxygenase 2-like n=1 Tax=Triticum urartu TaxID=4572 RepID=UPI0020430E7A|nr:acireductone dioxygenase 2-like [Triticum urartu]
MRCFSKCRASATGIRQGRWEEVAPLSPELQIHGSSSSEQDIRDVYPKKLPNYKAKLKNFEEHLHTDEEIRYFLEGSGYFDARDQNEEWICIAVKERGMIVLPAGMCHGFTLDNDNYIKGNGLKHLGIE